MSGPMGSMRKLVAAGGLIYKAVMGALFAALAVWPDPVARDGPAQMACDEALLSAAEIPVLRIFRWAGPWVSAGYFVPWEEACAARPDLPVCRRWTGGGIVIHEGDFTFSLVAPRREEWARQRPESYRTLHEALTKALQAVGCAATLVADRQPASAQCFAGPVQHDVLLGARKIAGGAQRRSKAGLLHQGSLQLSGLPGDWVAQLAGRLAEQTLDWQPVAGFEDQVLALVNEKYAQPGFLRPEAARGQNSLQSGAMAKPSG